MEIINNLAIIQARMGSSRLPNKVLMNLEGKTVLERVMERVAKAELVDEVIVATTIETRDLEIVRLCANKGIRVFCGSENDVLDRYYQVAKLIKPKNIIRITADCPLIDPKVIDMVIKEHNTENYDYTSNALLETFPDGEDVEAFKFSILQESWYEAKLASQREHVTQYIIHNDKYVKMNVTDSRMLGEKRWTLDDNKDYNFILKVYEELFKDNENFSMEDILNLLKIKPEIEDLNKGTIRNEGLLKSLSKDNIFEG